MTMTTPFFKKSNHDIYRVDNDSFEVIAPPEIYAVVGVSSNIFFANMLKEADPYSLVQWDVTGLAGSQLYDRWTFTPIDVTKNGAALTISTNNLSGRQVNAKTLTCKVASASAHGNVNLLWVGDSTSPATLMGYLAAYDTSDTNIGITFVGTQNSPNFNESWPGKTLSWIYTNASSPFVKSGVFNFDQYLKDNSLVTPDLITLQLGINDVFGTANEAAAVAIAASNIAIFEGMISQFRTKNTGVKVFINLVSMPSDQDKFGTDYGNKSLWAYKRKVQIYNEAVLNHTWPHYVTIIAPMLNINPSTGMINGVHPNNAGYQAIADAAYAAIKNKIPTQISYHDSKYNSATRLTTTTNLSLSDSSMTTIKQSSSFDGASATFKINKKTSYRIKANVAKGNNTTTSWNVGILLWNNNTAVSYDIPSGSQGIFNQFVGNLNYATYSASMTSVYIDTTINLSAAPDFTHLSLHFSGYASGRADEGEFIVVDLSTLQIQAL